MVKTEIRGVVIEKHTEVAHAAASLTATNDDAMQRDQRRISPPHQIDQARTVGRGVLSGELSDDETVDAHLDRVRVDWVFRIRDQKRNRVPSNGIVGTRAEDLPELVLVVRLTNHLQRLRSREQRRPHALKSRLRLRPGGPRRDRRLCRG
jgi:hypothetical protein